MEDGRMNRENFMSVDQESQGREVCHYLMIDLRRKDMFIFIKL